MSGVTIRKLFERHYPALVRFLYCRVGDRDRAADLAQEAFLRLLTHRPRRPRAWLYAVAANLARDAAAAERRRDRHMRLLHAERMGEAAATPEESLARRQASERVRSALAALSDRDRTLLILRQEGFSYRHIAEILGVSRTSIGPLLGRARRRLVRRFRAGEDEDDDAISSA